MRGLPALLAISVLAPGPAPAEEPADERARVLGSFLDAHWQLPIPPQGVRPEEFAEAEASLDPTLCGACHPQQLREWQTSLHAGAYSPGFAGQLVEGSLATPEEIRSCQTCHAPLAEQQPFDAAGEPQDGYDPKLRAGGIVCAGCHVRAHRRYGPPRRPELPTVDAPLPHGGFEARAEFQESRFCAPCHQFFDDPGVNGKPVENTWAEWKASPHAAEGRTCQSCHMPDRAHLWRGIHDPEMVRAAVDVELVAGDLSGKDLEASLVLASRDIGHAFPSYVTPRVFLSLWQEDAAGQEIPDTRRESTIGREIDFSTDSEVFDTRVMPGETARLDYAVPRGARAISLVGRVTVDPDFHYRRVFAHFSHAYEDPRARALMEEANERTQRSSYTLEEIRRKLP